MAVCIVVFRVRKHHSKNGYRQNGYDGVRVDWHPIDVSVLVKYRWSVGVVCPRDIYKVTIILMFRLIINYNPTKTSRDGFDGSKNLF